MLGLQNNDAFGVQMQDPGHCQCPQERGAEQLSKEKKRGGKMPLLRPGVCMDAVAGRNICNIRKTIADWERRAGGPVGRDQLVNSWLKKFQFGWGRKLLPWDEEVSSDLDKLDNLFS